MINMVLYDYGLKVTGHAPRLHGQSSDDDNLVCAAVSALVQTLFDALVEIGHADASYETCEPGNVWIKWSDMARDGETIISAFKIGIENIQRGYPGTIRFEDER